MADANLQVKDAAGATKYLKQTGAGTDPDPHVGHVVVESQPALAAGENHAGSVGGNGTIITVTPTLTVHANYVANDYVGTSGVAMDFATAARSNGNTGYVVGAELIDYALQSIPAELWLFDTAPTPPADSAAWSISDAEALTLIGVIPFSAYYASALNSVSNGVVPNGQLMFKAGALDQSIFGCLVTRGAPTYADGDVSVRLSVVQD